MKFKRVDKNEIPVETENDMWINGHHTSYPLQEILDKIQEKWPGISLDDVEIQPYHHHELAIHYDLHDPSDYTTYLYISKKEA